MKIFLTKAAKKDIAKINPKLRKRFFDKFEELEFHPNPIAMAKRINRCVHGTYRLRIADKYRILFSVKNSEIIIGRIGPRDKIYKANY
jgi:mRNA-degrading endonuclease RelE of RelBE toxin-antitoxin system